MRCFKLLILFLTYSISGLSSLPRNEKKNSPDLQRQFEKAENFLKHENFSEAIEIYNELYNSDHSNYNLCYKLGECYIKSKEAKAKAIIYLEKASAFVSLNCNEASFEEKKASILTYKFLGEAYHQSGKFDLAITNYKKFKQILPSSTIRDHSLIVETNRLLEMCYTAKKLVATPVNVKIANMGSSVNSKYPDYAPVFTADQSTMILTSGRPSNVGGQTYNGGKYFEDIYISTKKDSVWTEAKNIGPPINTVDNEGSVCISADGQEILIYKDDKGDGNIYSTSLKGNMWSIPKKLNSHINSKYWEPSAFISSNGRTLYFVSDRPGGFGGRDIYKSDKNINGDWGRAVNLGASVNSKYDEDAPFLHPDGVTLYFSSNGHETIGGFDIFECKLQDNLIWSEARNIGYPINSPGDDAFYVLSPDKKIAYYTSIRDGGYGEKDNYVITFPEVKDNSLELQKGIVLSNEKDTVNDIKITITDNNTNELIGVYHPNSSTGKYLFMLTPGKSHNITYEAEGYMFYSENRYVSEEDDYSEITKSIEMTPIAIGSKVVLNNIFFDFDRSTLRPNSSTELNRLYDFMIKYPSLIVEILGYTDSKGNDEYNIKLSTERANSVIDFLTSKGIKKERMVANGYGESKPHAPNYNNDGKDFPDGRQLNRRVELKITEMK